MNRSIEPQYLANSLDSFSRAVRISGRILLQSSSPPSLCHLQVAYSRERRASVRMRENAPVRPGRSIVAGRTRRTRGSDKSAELLAYCALLRSCTQ